MIEAKTIYRQSRPAQWPAPEGTNITVTAKIDNGDVVGITWERDDLIAKGGIPTQVTLTAEEFRAIAAAVAAQSDPEERQAVDDWVMVAAVKAVRESPLNADLAPVRRGMGVEARVADQWPTALKRARGLVQLESEGAGGTEGGAGE